ncbi:hypothetical protein H113_04483 [Trichophyton rubrum MR1459]|uniref:Uncharacterized protein n=1 Tax=Trichophyton rubrum (strain ATCC MYA-4607 / CBS 118892) TaxID=559305 RepID=A0A080WL06_TRIRC|nr:uncharacterized protein TERG_12116 [Trichophyton rubrum CBS 118892]EZF95168.1 hypothetical protein H113_04483 [Trichophyton rubrum MR1459]EZG06165.1 hypothetical protein H106_04265 [Trichophyton rubrum CBS 735.88]KFL61502.1 hypothetical protein TERG_12116 [Trichophyton rubrum CBS 118892]
MRLVAVFPASSSFGADVLPSAVFISRVAPSSKADVLLSDAGPSGNFLSALSCSAMASFSLLALSSLNCRLSTRLIPVASSLVLWPISPLLFFSRSSHDGSLLLRLPLPKKPISHNIRMVLESVTWMEEVEASK